MNLLIEPWIPVKTKGGKDDYICVSELGRLDLAATNAPRADFNAALMTFLIGLLQTFYAPKNPKNWGKCFKQPPDKKTLQAIFNDEKYKNAFNLDGDGKRFMQDKLAKNPDKLLPVEEMVFGAPGDSTKEKNIDHFIKRTKINGLCPSCIALALITANNFAEDGGQGYFQSMRGNGFVSTLICIDEKQHEPSLWKNLWLNILVSSQDFPKAFAWENKLPWEEAENRILAIEQRITQERRTKNVKYKERIKKLESQKKKISGRDNINATICDGNPYFAWMRRFWIEFTENFSTCSLCYRKDRLVSQFYKMNNGFKYPKEIWQNKHPLSPALKYTRRNYTENNKKYKDKLLAVEMTRNGLPYTYWQAFIEQSYTRAPAMAINEIFSEREKRYINSQLIIHSFGFAMKSNSPLGWFDSKIPLYLIEEDRLRSAIESEINRWINAADRIGNSQTGYIAYSIRSAWFDENPNKNKDKKDNFRNEKAIEISRFFWGKTEGKFFNLVKRLYDSVESLDASKKRGFRQEWYDYICREAQILFDYWAFKASIQTNPKRIAKAHNWLDENLKSNNFKNTLGL